MMTKSCNINLRFTIRSKSWMVTFFFNQVAAIILMFYLVQSKDSVRNFMSLFSKNKHTKYPMSTCCVAQAFSPQYIDQSNIKASASTSSRPPNDSIPVQSRTSSQSIRESATLVDWERPTELERRIRDGIYYSLHHRLDNYNHYPQKSKVVEMNQQPTNAKQQRHDHTDEITPIVRGIFCGCRTTYEERCRLRSANDVS